MAIKRKKRKSTSKAKKLISPTKVKTMLHHAGLRLPHGYEIAKRKRK